MADDRTRPAWWPRWMPPRCRTCRAPLLPGEVTLSWVNEPGCPANEDGRGHHVWACGRCYAEIRPPDCTGQ